MEDNQRDTVVVEDRRRPSYGWLIALGVILLLIIAFFSFGGANLFNGGAVEETEETVEIDTPDNVQVQP